MTAAQAHTSPLSGRNAIVTGASSGIGRACALLLAKAGASVLVNYHSDAEGADEVVTGIEQIGGKAIACRADVGAEEEVRAMFARATQAFGRLHLLVNNAGIQKDAQLTDMTLADWRAVIDSNLQGQFLCAREAAREFCRHGRATGDAGPAGNIICVSSVHDRIPWAGHANYAASKGGVTLLMKSLAQELGPSGIRINAVAPGAIKTDINREVWQDEAGRRELIEKIPCRRIGEPDDVARAVLWLASDDSDYVHGHVLYVDGGMLLYPSFAED